MAAQTGNTLELWDRQHRNSKYCRSTQTYGVHVITTDLFYFLFSRRFGRSCCNFRFSVVQLVQHLSALTTLYWLKYSFRCVNFSTSNAKNTRLDCAQRAQTSAKTSNLNQKRSAIRIRIPGLIRIRIRCLPDHSQKCCGFITLLSSVILVVTMVYYTTPICIAPSRQANQKRCGRLRVIYGGEQSRL